MATPIYWRNTPRSFRPAIGWIFVVSSGKCVQVGAIDRDKIVFGIGVVFDRSIKKQSNSAVLDAFNLIYSEIYFGDCRSGERDARQNDHSLQNTSCFWIDRPLGEDNLFGKWLPIIRRYQERRRFCLRNTGFPIPPLIIRQLMLSGPGPFLNATSVTDKSGLSWSEPCETIK